MMVAGEFASSTLDQIKEACAGGTMTVYSVARPITPERAVGTLAGLVRSMAAERAEHPYLWFDGIASTYAQLHARSTAGWRPAAASCSPARWRCS